MTRRASRLNPGCPWLQGARLIARARLSVLILLLFSAGCGFGRGDGGPFCSDKCSDPKRVRDFFCNCVPKSEEPKDEDGSPSPSLGVIFERYGQCIPAEISPQVWIVNSSGDRYEVTWRHEYWEGGKQIWQKELTERLGPWGRKYVGCEGTLYYDNRYTILRARRLPRNQSLQVPPTPSSEALGMVPAGRELASSPAVLVAFDASGPPQAASCRSLCPDLATTARCTTTSVPQPSQEGLSVLYTEIERLGTSNGLIEADELKKWFSLSEDPCRRGPTAFFEGKFLNVGGPCVMELPLSDTLQAQLTIPMVLAGEIRAGEGRLDADFQPLPGSRPSIHFFSEKGEPALLDGDFGGEIVTLESDRQLLFLKVSTNRCIGVRF